MVRKIDNGTLKKALLKVQNTVLRIFQGDVFNVILVFGSYIYPKKV